MTAVATVPRGTIEDVALDLIDVGDNVRVNVAELEELAASIRAHGVLQPVKVVPAGDRFRLVWGQRRVLASRLAERDTIPAIVEASTSEGSTRSIEQLVENLHRADLNPIDRARAMRAVVDSGVKQADLAKQLGIAPSTVANDLAMLKAPEKVQDALRDGKLTAAHAKALSGLPAAEQERLATNAVANGYSAHQIERDAKYVRERQNDLAKRGKESAKAADRAIACLREGKVEPGATVYLSVPWGLDPDAVRSKVREAGYAVSDAWAYAAGEGCTCTAVKVDVQDGAGSKLVRACVDDAHRQAVEDARRARQKAEAAERERETKALEKAVAAALTAQPPHPVVVRLLLRTLDSYAGDAWTEYSKKKDAEAIAELAKRISLRHGTAYGKPLPVKTILAGLGVEVPAK